jgi:two-component system, sensor histidine kinase and response regulator
VKTKADPIAQTSASTMTHAVREEVLLSLVRNSMDAIESADGVIDYWNPAAEKLYGYTAAEAIGQPSTLLVPPEKLDEFASMRARLTRGERIEQFDTQRVRKDGTLIDVEITAFPVMDSTGKLAATSVISHDMTKRVELQRAIEQTAQLKADFLAKMSHEIRTPLNAMIGNAELQLLSDTLPEQRRYARIIQSSGELLLAIVNDILDYSKLSAGKMVLEARDLNLAFLIQGLVDAFSAPVRAKGIELSVFLDPHIPVGLQGDPKHFLQIINNLLSNAIKFTSVGKVSLRIAMLEENAGSVTLSFEVSDTGIGITPEVKSRLFQPFVQAERSTSRRFGGTGLGLAISAQLVQEMGGTIEVDSVVGKGSHFRFVLRFKKAETIAKPAAADPGLANLTGLRALLVGADTVSLGIISQYLRSRGIESLTVASEVAMNKLRPATGQDQRYAVVMLEHGPNHEGLSLAHMIKTDSVLMNTKVIIMSSEISTVPPAVADAWLLKPIDTALLSTCIDSLFPIYAHPASDIVTIINQQYPKLKDARVLVAEDNLTNQTLIAEQLGILGCAVHIADDATQALEVLAEGHYDIVLMDCELPGMNGYEAAAEIRRREGGRKHTPVIAFTAHISEDQKTRCFEAGMDGYLGKPLKLQTLAETLSAHLHTAVKPNHNLQAVPAERTGDRLDPAAIAEIAELSKATGRNLFRKLSDIFISDLARQAELIAAAIGSRDMPALAREIHPLGSASAIVGAIEFAAVCARAEQYARDGQADSAISLSGELLSAAQLLPDMLRSVDSYK